MKREISIPKGDNVLPCVSKDLNPMRKWAHGDLNPGSSPCKGDVITELDYEPKARTAKIHLSLERDRRAGQPVLLQPGPLPAALHRRPLHPPPPHALTRAAPRCLPGRTSLHSCGVSPDIYGGEQHVPIFPSVPRDAFIILWRRGLYPATGAEFLALPVNKHSTNYPDR